MCKIIYYISTGREQRYRSQPAYLTFLLSSDVRSKQKQICWLMVVACGTLSRDIPETKYSFVHK